MERWKDGEHCLYYTLAFGMKSFRGTKSAFLLGILCLRVAVSNGAACYDAIRLASRWQEEGRSFLILAIHSSFFKLLAYICQTRRTLADGFHETKHKKQIIFFVTHSLSSNTADLVTDLVWLALPCLVERSGNYSLGGSNTKWR